MRIPRPACGRGALRAAIERVLADSTAGEVMGQAGRRLVCERHSLDQYVASLAEIVVGTASATGEMPLGRGW